MFRPASLRLVALVIAFLSRQVTAHASPAAVHRPDDRLVVHEWGTFTSLQDETGRTIPGINTDDEPLPAFVHRLADHLIINPSDLAPVYYKGVPRVHRGVTMRLETPVIYFYPPRGTSEPLALDVRVRFRGGWLTEYYPDARVDAPGLQQGRFRFGPITSQTTGLLEWSNLRIGGNPSMPPTDAHVWLAPRQTQAAAVQTSDGEGEKYLFYRGVGHLPAPLRVRRDAGRDVLSISEHFDPKLFDNGRLTRPSTMLWLTHIRDDGTVAFRTIGRTTLSLRPGHTIAAVPATFHDSEYSRENLGRLRDEMHAALIEDGLYADEATALLSTWELGYFKSPGARVFFLLPQQWTDAVLPLDVSAPAEISRTMVGRIELVTPEHRLLMQGISAERNPDLSWFYGAREGQSLDGQALQSVWEGKARLKDLSVAVPADYRAYIELGRFRNALILDELHRNADSPLRAFAREYHISYFSPGE